MSLEAEDFKRRVITGAMASAAITPAIRILGLVAVALLTRTLGPGLYGVLAIAIAATGSQSLVDLGLASTTSRFVAQSFERGDFGAVRQTARLALLGYTAISVAYTAVALILLPHIPDLFDVPVDLHRGARALWLMSIPLFALSNVSMLCTAVLGGLQRLPLAVVGQLLGQAALVATLATGRSFGSSVAVTVVAFISSQVVQIAVLAAGIGRFVPKGRPAMRPWRLREFFAAGGRVQLILVVDYAVFQAPRFIAGAVFGPLGATRMDLALRLPQAASGLVLALLPPLLPAAAYFSQDRKQSVARLHDRAVHVVAIVAGPAFATMFTLGPWLTDLITGSELHLDLAVRVLAVGFLLQVLVAPAMSLLIGSGRTRLVTLYKILLAVLAAGGVLSVAAIAEAGPEGMAAVVGASAGAAAVWVSPRVARVLGSRSPLGIAWRPVLMASVLYVPPGLWASSHPNGAVVALALVAPSVLYPVALMAGGDLKWREVVELVSLLRRRAAGLR